MPAPSVASLAKPRAHVCQDHARRLADAHPSVSVLSVVGSVRHGQNHDGGGFGNVRTGFGGR